MHTNVICYTLGLCFTLWCCTHPHLCCLCFTLSCCTHPHLCWLFFHSVWQIVAPLFWKLQIACNSMWSDWTVFYTWTFCHTMLHHWDVYRQDIINILILYSIGHLLSASNRSMPLVIDSVCSDWIVLWVLTVVFRIDLFSNYHCCTGPNYCSWLSCCPHVLVVHILMHD